MTNRETGFKIACSIRCIDPVAVEVATRKLDAAGVAWIDYTCKLSGARESVLLIGDRLAAEIMIALPPIENPIGMKILAGLYSAELCECDVETLTGAAEHEVVSQLQRFTALEMVAHRTLQGMNYYRLTSDKARKAIKNALDVLD